MSLVDMSETASVPPSTLLRTTTTLELNNFWSRMWIFMHLYTTREKLLQFQKEFYPLCQDGGGGRKKDRKNAGGKFPSTYCKKKSSKRMHEYAKTESDLGSPRKSWDQKIKRSKKSIKTCSMSLCLCRSLSAFWSNRYCSTGWMVNDAVFRYVYLLPWIYALFHKGQLFSKGLIGTYIFWILPKSNEKNQPTILW